LSGHGGGNHEGNEPGIQVKPNADGNNERNRQMNIKKPLEAEFFFIAPEPSEGKIDEKRE